ncbi:hypothetical protein ABZ397_15585 [Streptomyces sp. NPDC005876]|uniref:hypothetical protein n=1 Tax=Streptomyces sp. NPDC005876 TaxID=3157076 RepID=UPI0033E615DC
MGEGLTQGEAEGRPGGGVASVDRAGAQGVGDTVTRRVTAGGGAARRAGGTDEGALAVRADDGTGEAAAVGTVMCTVAPGFGCWSE